MNGCDGDGRDAINRVSTIPNGTTIHNGTIPNVPGNPFSTTILSATIPNLNEFRIT